MIRSFHDRTTEAVFQGRCPKGFPADLFKTVRLKLTVLNSASPGVVVSNIDNGYAAGVFAARIARRSIPR